MQHRIYSLLWSSVEDNCDCLFAINLSQLYLDVLQEVMISWVEANLSHCLAQQPRSQGLDLLTLAPGVNQERFEAGVDQLVHIFGLKVLLGLVLVNDEVTAAVVPINGPLVVTEQRLVVGFLLFIVHQIESVGEFLRLDFISFGLHFLKIVLICLLDFTEELLNICKK